MEGWIGASLLVIGFVIVCRVFRLVESARRVFSVSGAAFAVMGDPTLDEDSKERAMQRHAIHLFGLFLRLVIGGGLALALPIGTLWIAERAGWISLQASLETGLSLPFILVVTAVSILAWLGWKRLRANTDEASATASDYSTVDRMLHRVAFASVPVQIGLSTTENRLYRRRLDGLEPERPVFVTGLPRSGTTLLLEMCHQTGEFVAHTYRQMPFVINPLMWNAFSKRFRRNAAARERAHGDGMLIATDSPEALEEMLWMPFWKEHYGRSAITPWSPQEEAAAFLPFFRGHMTKMLALPADGGAQPRRYLSKNNLNIARIDWLRAAFPDARFVVPFREPRQHAASLLRQHRNFLAQHRQDPFVREYMAAIGHFDFGENLRPVNFNGWLDADKIPDPETLDFWLAYWTSAYRALQRESDSVRVRMLDFDVLCATPESSLRSLAAFLELEAPERLVHQADRVRPPREHSIDTAAVDQEILQKALALYEELRDGSEAAIT